MSTARTLIEALGADAIAAAAEVDPRTVANKAAGQFPAYWWLAISALCAERGVPCPPEAFAFQRKTPAKGEAAA